MISYSAENIKKVYTFGRRPVQLYDETERIFCTTDVHKAFDQVYRDGTVYLLCAIWHGSQREDAAHVRPMDKQKLCSTKVERTHW